MLALASIVVEIRGEMLQYTSIVVVVRGHMLHHCQYSSSGKVKDILPVPLVPKL